MTPAQSPLVALTRSGLARSFLLVLLPLVLLPLVVVAFLVYQQSQANLVAQVNAQINTLATSKQAQMRQWAGQHVARLTLLTQDAELLRTLAPALATAEPAVPLLARLDVLAAANPDFTTLVIADAESGRILATNARGRAMLGQSLADQAFFQTARFEPLFVEPRFDPQMDPAAVSLIVAAPVVVPGQGARAVLIAELDDEPLLAIIAPVPGLGATGQAYAITTDGYRVGLSPDSARVRPQSEGIRRALEDQLTGGGTYADGEGEQVAGYYAWVPELRLALLVEQSWSEALAPLQQTVLTLGAAMLAAAGLSLAAGVFLTRRITAPIQALTDSAARLAGGDLDAQVEVRRADEIGQLAAAFNRMTEDLRASYRTLERASEASARQLAVTAEMSRIAAANLSFEQLLLQVVELIRDRFGYDHVLLFLIDETGAHAVLAEASSPEGKALAEAGFKIPLAANAIIGWVARNQMPRLAAQVAADPLYRLEPRLADVRSEAAFPLRIGEQVIGVLDCESRTPEAFAASDVEVLQTLADQIAVSVENSRLFERQQRVLQLEELVLSLTTKIHRTFKPENILQSTATELGRALGARRAVVRLFPSSSSALGKFQPQPPAPAPAADPAPEA